MVNYYYIIPMLILGVLLLIIVIWFLLRVLKKKNKSNIPEDVIADFNKAEQMMKDSKGTLEPQSILWKIYKDKNTIEIETPIQQPIQQSIQQEQQEIPQDNIVTEIKPKSKNKLARLFRRR